MNKHAPVILPKISIVTIVYNGADSIAATMDSIIEQSYPCIEYILIDGASNDKTLEIIQTKITQVAEITFCKKNNIKSDLYLEATKHDNAYFTFKLLSEPDNGIYDAMNKGIELASGEWCNFMNCGDRFYKSITVEKLFNAYNEHIRQAGGGTN